MSRTLHRLLTLLLCLALVQSALPARAVMACVTGSGVVLDLCPEGGHRRTAPMAEEAPHRACCHKWAVAVYDHAAGMCLTDGGVYCATVSVGKVAPPTALSLSPLGIDMPIVAPPPVPVLSGQPPIVADEGAFPDTSDPPPSQPFAPDLARAPPIA